MKLRRCLAINTRFCPAQNFSRRLAHRPPQLLRCCFSPAGGTTGSSYPTPIAVVLKLRDRTVVGTIAGKPHGIGFPPSQISKTMLAIRGAFHETDERSPEISGHVQLFRQI